MVRSGDQPSLREPSICSDEVMNGGRGRSVRGVEVTAATRERRGLEARGDECRVLLDEDPGRGGWP